MSTLFLYAMTPPISFLSNTHVTRAPNLLKYTPDFFFGQYAVTHIGK